MSDRSESEKSPFLAFEDDPAVIYVLDADFRIVYCNRAWDRFAAENGGGGVLREHQIGRSVLEATPRLLKPFYAKLYAQVLFDGGRGNHFYECSAPSTYRAFNMELRRMHYPAVGLCIVVINSLVWAEPLPPSDALDASRSLQKENGPIGMCAHCRRTRMPNDASDTHEASEWIWIPELVKEMPVDVSHDICPVCFELHYGNRT